MLHKSVIEVGRQHTFEQDRPQSSFHLSLPIESKDCAECQRIADAGMEEIGNLVTSLEGRADREAVLNRIGDAVRRMVGTRTIKMIAARSLGSLLGADRCYFISYDIDNSKATVENDWHNPDLETIAGHFVIDAALIHHLAVDQTGTHVAARISSSGDPLLPLIGRGNAQAFVHVPIMETQSVVGAVVVTVERATRDWTMEEVALVENVASIARSAIDLDRLRMREHSLRTSFQTALLPEVPDVHGLHLSIVSRPAQAEIGVGGDFYDVLPLSQSRTAIVLGDAGGSGLDAVADVTALRHMIRYVLYRGNSLSESVSELDAVLLQHKVIAQPATAFISIYDAAAQTLTYVGCGQEPALLRSSNSDHVTVLNATAPALGAGSDRAIEEQTIPLQAGDALIIYTDGIAEADDLNYPTDNVARLTQILRHARPPFSAHTIIDFIMAGIVEASGGETTHSTATTTGGGPYRSRCSGVEDDLTVLAAVFTN